MTKKRKGKQTVGKLHAEGITKGKGKEKISKGIILVESILIEK